MKRHLRLMSALMAAVLLFSFGWAAAETEKEAVAVHIPSRVTKLDLPEDVREYDGDAFRTGIEDAVTTVERATVIVKTECGKTEVEYIRSVTVTYPSGNFIRQVSAIYRNDTGGSLAKYNITYQVDDGGLYTIYYSAKEKSMNIPPAGSKSTYVPFGYSQKTGTFRYPWTDKILKGAYYGSGVQLTCGLSGVWHPYDTGKYMDLYSIFSFISPRVEW